jgi:TfoX/Sxy family transcriptional regulator of competence genes
MKPDIDPRFQPIADAFAKKKDVTCGVMMASVGLKVGGKIFAMFPRGEFVVKLPKARVDELIEAGAGRRFDPGHGRLMKEWIVVAPGKADWLALAHEAFAYVRK